MASKVAVIKGLPLEACPHLRNAIDRDRNYSIKAAKDDAFGPYVDHVNGVIELCRNDARVSYEQSLGHLETLQKTFVTLVQDENRLECYQRELDSTHVGHRESAKKNSLFGFIDAEHMLTKARKHLKGLIGKEVTVLTSTLETLRDFERSEYGVDNKHSVLSQQAQEKRWIGHAIGIVMILMIFGYGMGWIELAIAIGLMVLVGKGYLADYVEEQFKSNRVEELSNKIEALKKRIQSTEQRKRDLTVLMAEI